MKLKLLILACYSSIATLVISSTTHSMALEHDARSYYDTAVLMVEKNTVISSFFAPTPQFIDHGYPTFLAGIMSFVGTRNILALQIANYVLWFISTYLVYLSLKLVGTKQAKWGFLLMLFSPLYLTFSGKVYSEPFACLGTSLLIYGLVTMLKLPYLRGQLALILGGIILFSTKSVLLPALIPLGIYIILNKQLKYFVSILLAPMILLPSIMGSLGGGRSLYTLNIQSSKVQHSYNQIVSCVPYYLSYPLGKAVLPQYEGICHQNDASKNMPMYDHNPYVLADISREAGFSYSDWLVRIIRNPVKYLLVMIVSLSNIIFFEGIYPSILLLLPLPIMAIGFGVTKIILSTYLWIKVISKIKTNWLLGFPLLYFALIVTNFPVEPRYFYPFIPYIYFLSGLDHNQKKL